MTKTNNCFSQFPIEKTDFPIRGMIHIGAHYAQEYTDYINYGIKNIMFIEPLKDNYEKMMARLAEEPRLDNTVALNMALGNTTGEIEMFVETANQGMSSSILEAGTHIIDYPSITFDTKELVKIDKLDNIEFDRTKYNALNIDVQGYELEVLKGASETLEHIMFIVSEINVGEVYKGCSKLSEIDEYLKPFGFVRIFTHLYENVGYGDAIYLKIDDKNG